MPGIAGLLTQQYWWWLLPNTWLVFTQRKKMIDWTIVECWPGMDGPRSYWTSGRFPQRHQPLILGDCWRNGLANWASPLRRKVAHTTCTWALFGGGGLEQGFDHQEGALLGNSRPTDLQLLVYHPRIPFFYALTGDGCASSSWARNHNAAQHRRGSSRWSWCEGGLLKAPQRSPTEFCPQATSYPRSWPQVHLLELPPLLCHQSQ